VPARLGARPTKATPTSPAVVEDLLTGQYDQPLRVVAFNPVERWSRDATEEIAEELDRRISAEGREVSEALQEFVESNIGRKIGVQLALPLRLQT
jgi:hypothetical protein